MTLPGNASFITSESGKSGESDASDTESVVALARGLVPELRARANEISSLGRIPEDLLERMHNAGLFNILTPRKYGGLQANVSAMKATISELGRGDLSVAWVTAVINNGVSTVCMLYSKEIADRVFADFRDARVGGPALVQADVRKVPGGFVVDQGLWAFNSGVYHISWDLLMIPLPDDGGHVVGRGLALVPIKDITILDNWDTIGLRGTGSSGISVKDVFVPENHVVSLATLDDGYSPFSRGSKEPLYHLPIFPFFSAGLLFAMLGAARAALETFLDLLPNRGIYGLYSKQAEAAVTHLQLGEITAKIDAADVIVRQVVDALDWGAKGEGQHMQRLDRARLRRDLGFSARLISEAVDLLVSVSGGSTAATANPIGRIWRDIRAAGLHGALLPPTNFEIYGRMLCGATPEPLMV
jgi:3-hydroxy-9,10-secoandrosta-1,3,5(10)-triene-9,17-dione monooxygenase